MGVILLFEFLARLQGESGEDPRALVELLRADRIEDREQAAAKLKSLGLRSLSELDRAASDPDREVADRARSLANVIRVRKALTMAFRDACPGVDERIAQGPDHLWTEAFLRANGSFVPRAPVGIPSLLPADLEPLASRAIRGASTPDERIRVCHALARWELKSAARETVEFLADSDDEVRFAASETLKAFASRTVIPRVIEFLGHRDCGVRIRAVDLLPALGAREAIPQMTRLLLDRDGGVRGITAAALGRLEGKGATPKLLLIIKHDRDTWVRMQAIQAMANVRSDETVPTLLALLRDRDLSIRKESLGILAEYGVKFAPDRITGCLGDQDAEIRSLALRNLAVLGARECIPEIAKTLKDPEPVVRAEAAESLAVLGARGTIPDLIRSLEDPVLSVRLSGVQSLATLGAREAIPAYRKALRDPARPLGVHPVEALVALDAREAIPEIASLLDSVQSWQADLVLRSLVRLEAREAIPAIRNLLGSPDPGIKESAALTLLDLGSDESLETLLARLRVEKKAPCSCRRLERALVSRGRKELIPLLRERLRDPGSLPDHVLTAPESLAALGDRECIPDFIHLLESDNSSLRGAASRALTILHSREALPAMLKLLGKSEVDTCQVAEWMVALDLREYLDLLRKAMIPCSAWTKSLVAGTLVRLGSFEEIHFVLERPYGWFDLNALRQPREWEILSRTSLPSGQTATMNGHLIQLEKATGLKVDWPENPFLGSSVSSSLDFGRVPGPALPTLEFLENLTHRTSQEVVLERGVIRIMSRPQAQILWNEWATKIKVTR